MGSQGFVSRTRPSLGSETRTSHRIRHLARGVRSSFSLEFFPPKWHDHPRIDVGKTRASGKNRRRGKGWTKRRCAARRVSPLRNESRKRHSGDLRDASDKEEGHGPRPCEESRAPVDARASFYVAEVDKQFQISNKVPRSASKRVAVGLNGNLAKMPRTAGCQKHSSSSDASLRIETENRGFAFVTDVVIGK